jgi:uncharacterized membrane protein
LGSSVSLTGNGSVLAIGSWLATIHGLSTAGAIDVYQYNGSAWTPRGRSVTGTQELESVGSNVQLTPDGQFMADIVLINLRIRGRVYQFLGDAWTQRGQDLSTGEAYSSTTDADIALSADGLVVAVGDPSRKPNVFDEGGVNAFEWDGTNWNPRGQELLGGRREALFGEAVSLSADGLVLTVGAPSRFRFFSGEGPGIGQVVAFEWNGFAWVDRGQSLNAKRPGDRFGSSVALSANGLRLAIGAGDDYVHNSDDGCLGLCSGLRVQWNAVGSAWFRCC